MLYSKAGVGKTGNEKKNWRLAQKGEISKSVSNRKKLGVGMEIPALTPFWVADKQFPPN